MMETLVALLGRPGDGYAAARDSVTAAYRAGVPVLAGTDADAIAGSPAAVSPGDSLRHELELPVDAGLTRVDAWGPRRCCPRGTSGWLTGASLNRDAGLTWCSWTPDRSRTSATRRSAASGAAGPGMFH